MAADYQLIQEFETVGWRDMIRAFQPVCRAYIWPKDREFLLPGSAHPTDLDEGDPNVDTCVVTPSSMLVSEAGIFFDTFRKKDELDI